MTNPTAHSTQTLPTQGEIYFSYGSCMNEHDFRRTVPEAILLGRGVVDDYRLDFTLYASSRAGGVADVIRFHGGTVEGVVWFVPAESMKDLDAREHAPYVYQRENVKVDLHLTGESVEAITYSVVRKEEPCRPTEEYLNLMIDGALRAELPEDYIERFASYARSIPERLTGLEYGSDSIYSHDYDTPLALWDKI